MPGRSSGISQSSGSTAMLSLPIHRCSNSICEQASTHVVMMHQLTHACKYAANWRSHRGRLIQCRHCMIGSGGS